MFNTANLSHLEDLIEEQSETAETAETAAQSGIDAGSDFVAPNRDDVIESMLRNDEMGDSGDGLFFEAMSGGSYQEIFSKNVSKSDVSEFLGAVELVMDAA